jgi:serine protease AprX
MRRALPLALAGLLAFGATTPVVDALTSTTALPAPRPGTVRLAAALAGAAPTDAVRGIATFDAVPGAGEVRALEALGLAVQPMEHLPLAIVQGTALQLADLSASSLVRDLYPEDRIELTWDESNASMTADAAQALGFTGEGVQVAVVDSGIDATHPDLADHVVHNVKLVSGEYVNQRPDPARPGDSYLVVPADEGPYSNTDNTSGHGTHVAGIIAADGTTDPSQTGVAPDAELIGYAIGEVLFTTAVVTAYDHMLDNPDWGIDVVNNSWGNQFMLFDPADPVNVATKALAATGVAVVFAAGNSGSEDAEMTLNPFSQAPWVISVAAGDNDRNRADFSSNGLVLDNSVAGVGPDADGHVHFDGDRLGQYHPDVTAPGSDVVSSGTTTLAVGPSEPGGTASASGTSMASPHVAGAVALLRSAAPGLTRTQIQDVLQATAVPLADGSQFWQTGFGYVDLAAAVRFVTQTPAAALPARLANELRADRGRLLAARSHSVVSSDLWTWEALPATLGGLDSHEVTVEVPEGVDAIKVTLAHPSGALLGVNGFEYPVTITDADGNVIGTTEESAAAGVASALVGVGDAARGTWTFTISGDLGLADPDTVDSESVGGRMLTLQVALLADR